MLSILSGRTSKTEFVCKSYGQLKFVVENRQKLTKLSNSDWNRTALVGTGQPDLDADLTFFLLNFFLLSSPLSFWSKLSGTLIKSQLGSDLQRWETKVEKRKGVWRWGSGIGGGGGDGGISGGGGGGGDSEIGGGGGDGCDPNSKL
jgi:hypothetical protein